MRMICSLAFAGVLLSSSALAQVTSIETNNPMPKGSANDSDKIVCEAIQPTGSRLGKRKICMSVAEWRELRRDHRDGVEGLQRQGTSVGCPNGAASC